jgi:hypothetical protein
MDHVWLSCECLFLYETGKPLNSWNSLYKNGCASQGRIPGACTWHIILSCDSCLEIHDCYKICDRIYGVGQTTCDMIYDMLYDLESESTLWSFFVNSSSAHVGDRILSGSFRQLNPSYMLCLLSWWKTQIDAGNRFWCESDLWPDNGCSMKTTCRIFLLRLSLYSLQCIS